MFGIRTANWQNMVGALANRRANTQHAAAAKVLQLQRVLRKVPQVHKHEMARARSTFSTCVLALSLLDTCAKSALAAVNEFFR